MNKTIILVIGIALLFTVLAGCTSEQQPTQPTNTKNTDEFKKTVYYELVKLQDSISTNDPDYGNKQVETYSTIAERYEITEPEVHSIVSEGIEKNWPVPPAP